METKEEVKAGYLKKMDKSEMAENQEAKISTTCYGPRERTSEEFHSEGKSKEQKMRDAVVESDEMFS